MRIKDFPYDITEDGVIKNIQTGRLIRPSLNKKRGYFYVCLYGENKRKNFILHRLMAECFLPKEEGKEYINHIDGDKTNNTLGNLEWCTSSENQLHSVKLGLRGKPVGNLKYEENTIEYIRYLRKKGFLLREISSLVSIPISTITHICLGSRRVI